jgi:hypothetical protein
LSDTTSYVKSDYYEDPFYTISGGICTHRIPYNEDGPKTVVCKEQTDAALCHSNGIFYSIVNANSACGGVNKGWETVVDLSGSGGYNKANCEAACTAAGIAGCTTYFENASECKLYTGTCAFSSETDSHTWLKTQHCYWTEPTLVGTDTSCENYGDEEINNGNTY